MRGRLGGDTFLTGIEARDAESVQAIVNLALLTGQIGKEGAGIFAARPSTTICRASATWGCCPTGLPGYRPVAQRSGARRKFGEAVGHDDAGEARASAARSILYRPRRGQGARRLWLCRYDPVSTAFFGDAATALRAVRPRRGAASVHDRNRAICARRSADDRVSARSASPSRTRSAAFNWRNRSSSRSPG